MCAPHNHVNKRREVPHSQDAFYSAYFPFVCIKHPKNRVISLPDRRLFLTGELHKSTLRVDRISEKHKQSFWVTFMADIHVVSAPVVLHVVTATAFLMLDASAFRVGITGE